MKKFLTAALALVLILGCFAGCGENLNKTYEELDAMAAELPLVVTGYRLSTWKTDEAKGPWVQPLLQNNGDKEITSVELAIVLWNQAGKPIQVTFRDGNQDTDNLVELTYSNCNIAAGGTYGTKDGLAISEDSAVPVRIQAVPVRWTYADGTTEENTNYKYWSAKYLNKDNIRADLANPQFEIVHDMTEEQLLDELRKQPLVVTDCTVSQWEQGDLLCATIKNNGEATIQSMLLAFATFDEEGNPVRVTWSNGDQAETNVVKLRMKDLALAYGGEYGADKGVGLHADSQKVAYFVAIPYYYTDIDGNTWENPVYDAWMALYEVE